MATDMEMLQQPVVAAVGLCAACITKTDHLKELKMIYWRTELTKPIWLFQISLLVKLFYVVSRHTYGCQNYLNMATPHMPGTTVMCTIYIINEMLKMKQLLIHVIWNMNELLTNEKKFIYHETKWVEHTFLKIFEMNQNETNREHFKWEGDSWNQSDSHLWQEWLPSVQSLWAQDLLESWILFSSCFF